MATVAFKNFLRYPHGRTQIVDGINYEEAEFIMCPKCWMKYIYIYLNFIFTLIAIWFAIESRDIGASIAVIIFIVVFNSISEIVIPRLLPGANKCQDVPFPPQTGEVIEIFSFIRLVLKYTSEESKTRFLKATAQEQDETGSEIESEDGQFSRKSSNDEKDSEDSLFPLNSSKNDLLHLDDSGEMLCVRQEFEKEPEYESILFHPLFSEGGSVEELFRQSLIESGMRLQMSKEESEILLRRRKFEPLRRTMSVGEAEVLLRRPLREWSQLRRRISEGEAEILLRRPPREWSQLRRRISEGEAEVLLRRPLRECSPKNSSQ